MDDSAARQTELNFVQPISLNQNSYIIVGYYYRTLIDTVANYNHDDRSKYYDYRKGISTMAKFRKFSVLYLSNDNGFIAAEGRNKNLP